MARLPRFFVPGLPLHVIQRGNARMTIFRAPGDALVYARCAAVAACRHGVAVHAYVLMSNHVHLLVTPSTAHSVPKMMQAIGDAYVPYFNSKYARTGTLWEGRYKAAIIDDEAYLLTCMRYIELNPVRAGVVRNPASYRWSSYHVNALGVRDPMIVPHAAYTALAATPFDRRVAYRELFAESIAAQHVDAIRDATQHGWALGDRTFRRTITVLSRRGERLPRGRRSTASEGPTRIPNE